LESSRRLDLRLLRDGTSLFSGELESTVVEFLGAAFGRNQSSL